MRFGERVTQACQSPRDPPFSSRRKNQRRLRPYDRKSRSGSGKWAAAGGQDRRAFAESRRATSRGSESPGRQVTVLADRATLAMREVTALMPPAIRRCQRRCRRDAGRTNALRPAGGCDFQNVCRARASRVMNDYETGACWLRKSADTGDSAKSSTLRVMTNAEPLASATVATAASSKSSIASCRVRCQPAASRLPI